MIKRLFAIVLLVACLGAPVASRAFADGNNPSNNGGATTGYEGQPGNQAGH